MSRSTKTINRVCPVCGTQYSVKPWQVKQGKKKTCSRACGWELSKITHRNKVTRIEGPCAVCGNPVSKAPSQVRCSKTPYLLCSRECHYKGRSLGIVGRVVERPYNVTPEGREAQRRTALKNVASRKAAGNYAHTEETKRKISESVTKAIQEGRIKRRSNLELRVESALKRTGIPFEPQYGLRDELGRYMAVPDFYFPNHNCVLEVNGTYWHADPREYPNGPETASQRRTASRYKRKCEILSERGIRLVEIWELDLQDDFESAIQVTLSQITEDPEAPHKELEAPSE